MELKTSISLLLVYATLNELSHDSLIYWQIVFNLKDHVFIFFANNNNGRIFKDGYLSPAGNVGNNSQPFTHSSHHKAVNVVVVVGSEFDILKANK